MTFNPSMVRTPEHLEKLEALHRECNEVSGTDLQINVIDTKPSNDAQRNPDSYATLMFRISGYNAFFTQVVRELQEELITKTEHSL